MALAPTGIEFHPKQNNSGFHSKTCSQKNMRLSIELEKRFCVKKKYILNFGKKCQNRMTVQNNISILDKNALSPNGTRISLNIKFLGPLYKIWWSLTTCIPTCFHEKSSTMQSCKNSWPVRPWGIFGRNLPEFLSFFFLKNSPSVSRISIYDIYKCYGKNADIALGSKFLSSRTWEYFHTKFTLAFFSF